MVRKAYALLLILCIIVAFPVAVLAIADPDTDPQVSAVYVYEDLLEDGDVGVLIDYYLDYATTPNETATDAYLVAFIDIDGLTQLKSTAPYTYQDSGYGRGLVWIPFTAAEVTTYSIASANETEYEVWLMGNPTENWTSDPPKTIAGIDYWQPDGSSASTLLALRVLYYADVLELIWSLDLITETPLGNRLTTLGESYFTNVIPNLRDMAPAAFSTGEIVPTLEDLDYSTTFGAIMTDGTGTVAGSPITFALVGDNTSVTTTVNVTALSPLGSGSFIFTLAKGTVGTVSDNTGTVTGSPVDLTAGTNTITVTAVGFLDVTLSIRDTVTGFIDDVTGTALDLTDVAADFGMTRWMFSGVVWFLLSIVICAAVYKGDEKRRGAGSPGGGKVVLLVFDIWIIGGVMLGLMHPLVAILMFIGFGVLTGYVLFFRGANV